MKIATQHEGLTFEADEAPFEGACFARLDMVRRKVVSWHRKYPKPAYSECGSHKAMRKAYEAKYGDLKVSGEFPYKDGKLWDAVIRTQKKEYINSLMGGQTERKGGWKYDASGAPRFTTTLDRYTECASVVCD
jgi:hypothetical protein